MGSNPGSGLTLPGTLRIITAYGIPAVRIENHAQRLKSGKLDSKGPLFATSWELLTNRRCRAFLHAETDGFDGVQAHGGSLARTDRDEFKAI